MIFVILLYALFASVFTIAKTGLEFTQPLFFVGSRMMLAGVGLLAYQGFKGEKFQFVPDQIKGYTTVKLKIAKEGSKYRVESNLPIKVSI